MAHSPIGHLVPLSKTLEEKASSPRIPLSEGPNVVGRNAVSLPDRRLSRKHVTLTAYADGSASLLVEGTNPVVVNAGNERVRVGSGEKVDIGPGCVIELIPGHHFFKYEVLSGDPSGSSDGGKNNDVRASEDRGRKRTRKDVQDQSFMRDSQSQANRGHGLPAWANTSCVSIEDVIEGNIVVAILSNYMVDIDWLIPACPILAKVPRVLVIHGEGDGTLDHMKRKKPANWVLHKPPLPISYGTHHSKAMLLVYPTGVRIIVHTANLIFVDWNNKSQGLWVQDFPWKDPSNAGNGCGFEDDLVDYLSALKWPEFNINVPAVGNFTINPSFFRKFDYRDSAVRLIASVPGYHTGSNLKKWGHMKLRSVLQECTFDKDFQKSPLVYQFSSLGSLDEKWMAELASSMSSGFSEDKVPLGLGDPLIIWPTVEDVRCSLEGYAAGNAIPSPLKNVEKEFLKKYWAKWKASHTGRCRAMPHIKTFARYKGQKLAWLLLTSANLSKAAWGALQKKNSQLMIRSYELGVLFLPSSIKRRGRKFSCTNNGVSSEDAAASSKNSEVRRAKLVTLAWQRSQDKDSSRDIISLPVPYELPPQSYSQEDVPWSWDRRYTKKDVYGQVWPRQVQLYAFQES
ncbi:hypothetical protein NL676_013137 [Syzygium grande]|nr:hypothetical protein NL676_013137 [Syzygium grande]